MIFFAINQRALAEQPASMEPTIKPKMEKKSIQKELPKSALHGLSITKAHIKLQPLDMDAIKAEDEKKDKTNKTLRIGVKRELPQAVTLLKSKSNLGDWTILPDGSRIWRLRIDAPGAIGIRVHIRGIVMPEQCEIFAYDTHERKQIRGPYSDRTLRAKDEFWTSTVFSESVTVECYCPTDIYRDKFKLTVDQIIQIYRDPLSMEKEGDCHNDVTCYPDWSPEANAVAGIIFGAYWCTGFLINDKDPSTYIDYFITANHCIDNQSKADDTEYYWFFQTDTCNGTPPSLSSVPSTDGGADYLAGQDESSGNDFTFLRLRNESPPGVTYAGWTIESPSSSETLTGIHHPIAYKRISFGNLDSSDANYWKIHWYSGVTEHGSSGSPLFDDSHRFIGQLWGGYSDCSYPDGIDKYGRFDVTYTHIQSWLYGGDDAYEPNNTLSEAYDLSSKEKNWLSTIAGLGMQADDDWYKISVTPGYTHVQVDCRFTDADGDIDIQLIDASGTVLAISQSITDNEFINYVVPNDGTYYIRVFYGDKGNTYDLWWDDLIKSDSHPSKAMPWIPLLLLNENPTSQPPSIYTNSLGMTFKLIPAGTFIMGSPSDELGRSIDEIQHQVTLTHPYYMQTTKVTQGQWEAVMGSNPSYFTTCGSDCPVESVSWNDVQTFITNLNSMGQGTYRLPTEAEWEYAARAGSTTAFANGDITITDCNKDPNLFVIGWYCYNSASTTHPVAQKQPNAWGLYGMHGNVVEKVQDWYGDYPSSPVTDPTGPSNGSYRVNRGGSWFSQAKLCRSAHRAKSLPDGWSNLSGFRLLMNP